MTDNAVLLRLTLEPEAQAFSDATATPPFLPDLGPENGRIAVDDVQSGEIGKPTIDEEWITVPGGPTGEVRVRIVKPAGAQGTLPVIFYIHGAGWVFGDACTPTIGLSASSPSDPTPRSCSPSTTDPRKRHTRPPSNRTTRPLNGS